MGAMGNQSSIAVIRKNIQAEMERKGLKSKPLSKKAGLSESAIRDLMRKVDDPRLGTLLGLASALDISTALLLGEMVPVVGGIGEAGKVTLRPAGADSETEYVPRPPSRGSGLVAYKVKGNFLFPAYRNGDVIYAARCGGPDKGLQCCLGVESICQIEGGAAFLRILTGGTLPGFYSLRWSGLEGEDNKPLAWVAPVLFVMRAINGATEV